MILFFWLLKKFFEKAIIRFVISLLFCFVFSSLEIDHFLIFIDVVIEGQSIEYDMHE